MANLKDQKVIIAGGSSGIGLATAQLLQSLGAEVIVTGRDASKLEKITQENPGLKAIALDSSDREAVKSFFAATGSFQHLVLSLSSSKGGGTFADMNLEDLRAGFEGKFWPMLQTLQTALPTLSKNGSVTIVTATSSEARLPGTSGLAAINGALEIMVPIISKELQPLRINAISPGVVNTPWWDFLPAADKQAAFTQFAKQVAVGRVAEAAEIAEAIAAFIKNQYINGSVLHVNGGLV
jgi:NAD(P)-dependent dehydrogenase (short-subunit alcohol dehydrogenase family)